MAEEKNKGGRPTKYKRIYDKEVYKLCLLGATNEEIADFFEVSLGTIDEWRKKHPKFLGAFKAGKEKADSDVAKSLFQRAVGYTHPEDRIFTYEGETIIVPTTKHYPPDTAAASLWLRNRRPDLWRDTKGLEHTGKNGGPIETKNASVIGEVDPVKAAEMYADMIRQQDGEE